MILRNKLGAWRGLGTLALCFLSLVGVHVMLRVALDCIPYYDLGIYAEGACHLSLRTPNPWLSARHIHLFNDHFDPIVALMVPFVRACPLPYGAVAFELLAVVLAVWPLAWLVRHGRLTDSGAVLVGMLVLFDLGTITAVHFPVHPTTWAMTPWVWLVAALELERYKVVVLAFVVLMACKEEFPFVAPVLCVLLWHRKQRMMAAWVAALGCGWLYLVYGLRPLWMGPIENHASPVFDGLLAAPKAYLISRLQHEGVWTRLPLMVAPCLCVWVWLQLRSRERRRPALGYLALLLPTFALRVFAQRWAHHYHAVTAAGLAVSFLPALRGLVIPRRLFVAVALLLAASNHERLRDGLSLVVPRLVTGTRAWCAYEPQRLASLRQARALLRARPNRRMLVGMANLPKLVDLPNTFVPPGPPSERQTPWELVFLEKPPHGMPYPPIDHDDIARWIAQWRAQQDTRILLDDAYVFVAEGRFLAPFDQKL